MVNIVGSTPLFYSTLIHDPDHIAEGECVLLVMGNQNTGCADILQ